MLFAQRSVRKTRKLNENFGSSEQQTFTQLKLPYADVIVLTSPEIIWRKTNWIYIKVKLHNVYLYQLTTEEYQEVTVSLRWLVHT